MPDQSDGYTGPLVYLTRQELDFLRAEVRLFTPKTQDEANLKYSLMNKLEKAFASDPKWRTPSP